MAGTPTGETVVSEDSKTTVTTPSAPPQVNTTDNSESEKLRKELEQAQMRANQLQNQLEAKSKAEEEARQKQLEEQNEFKSLYEQEKAKREAIETERQEAETKQSLSLAEQAIFAEFDPEAIEIAKEAGLSLNDDSDEAKTTLKSKLEKIQSKVVNKSVTPNNPGSVQEPDNKAELLQRMRAGDTKARDEAVSGLKSLDFMRQQAGYTKQ